MPDVSGIGVNEGLEFNEMSENLAEGTESTGGAQGASQETRWIGASPPSPIVT